MKCLGLVMWLLRVAVAVVVALAALVPCARAAPYRAVLFSDLHLNLLAAPSCMEVGGRVGGGLVRPRWTVVHEKPGARAIAQRALLRLVSCAGARHHSARGMR